MSRTLMLGFLAAVVCLAGATAAKTDDRTQAHWDSLRQGVWHLPTFKDADGDCSMSLRFYRDKEQQRVEVTCKGEHVTCCSWRDAALREENGKLILHACDVGGRDKQSIPVEVKGDKLFMDANHVLRLIASDYRTDHPIKNWEPLLKGRSEWQHEKTTWRTLPRPGTKEQVIVFGPIPLGEVLANVQDDNKELMEQFLRGSDISKARLIETLDQCQVFIIDHKRPSQQGDGWAFGGSDESSMPRIVLKGPLSYEIRTMKGKRFKLHVGEVDFRGSHTEDTFRQAPLYVRLVTDPWEVRKVGAGLLQVNGLDCNFFVKDLTWNVQGKIEWIDRKKAQGK